MGPALGMEPAWDSLLLPLSSLPFPQIKEIGKCSGLGWVDWSTDGHSRLEKTRRNMKDEETLRTLKMVQVN